MIEYKIADEIIEKTEEKYQVEGEDLVSFKARLIEASNLLDDEAWDSLSTITRDWINSSIRAIREANDTTDDPILPAFPEEIEAAKQQDSEVAENLLGERVRQRKQPALHRPGKLGATWHAKLVVFQNPNITYVGLQNEVEKTGFKITEKTALALLSGCRQDLKILSMLNMLKINLVIKE